MLVFYQFLLFYSLFKFEELEQKDIELRDLHVKTEKTTRMQSMNEKKISKELVNLKKTLLQERHLKLDAFQKVDELQSHLYDLEDEIINMPVRPQTSIIPNTSIDNSGVKVTTRIIKRSSSSGGTNSDRIVNGAKIQSGFPRLIGSASPASQHQILPPFQTTVLNCRPKTVTKNQF